MNVSVEIDNEILTVLFSGDYIIDSMINIFEKIEKQHGYGETKGILLDFEKMNEGISVFESYAFIKRLCRTAGGKRRIALFRKSGLTDGEMVCEAIGQNMGTEIKNFSDRIAAVRWLTEKQGGI